MRPRLKQLRRMVFGQEQNFRWLFLTPGQRKYWRQVGDGSSSSVVMAPLQWIGRNFPEAPPALWQKSSTSGEEERVVGKGDQGGDHNMLELMERPNDFYSGSTLWMATVMDYHLSGNGYWLKIRDMGGRPVAIWWVPSPVMTPIGDETTFIDHYDYKPGTETVEIDPADVVHFRYSLDPVDSRKGRSPLSSLLQEVFTDSEAADFTAAILNNMGVPGLLIAPKGDTPPGPDDVTATKDYMKESFGGDRRGEPLVMSGPTSVTQFGFSPEQLMLRELRRIPEERVTAALGVPAIVAGLGAGLDRSTFANYAEAREAAYQDNIIPAQRTMSEDVKYQLLPDFEPDDFRSFRVGFDLSNVRVLQEDRNRVVERMNMGVVGGWIRVSEARRTQELEVDDADEVYLRGVSIVETPAGEMPVPATLPQLSPGQGPGQVLPPTQPPELQPPAAAGRKAKVTRLHTRLVHAILRDSHVLSAVFAERLEAGFVDLGVACADAYSHMTVNRASRRNGNTKQDDADQIARLIVASLSVFVEEKFRREFEQAALRSLTQTVQTIQSVVNLEGGVPDPDQRRILESAGKRLGLIDLNKTTKDSIFRIISDGNRQGLGPVEIARRIREEVPAGRFVNAGPAYRSQLIARTETMWAQNTSSIALYRSSDVVGGVVAMDGTDDPECAERDGQSFSFDEAEQELENEHPNGTLCFAPIVQEEVPA